LLSSLLSLLPSLVLVISGGLSVRSTCWNHVSVRNRNGQDSQPKVLRSISAVVLNRHAHTLTQTHTSNHTHTHKHPLTHTVVGCSVSATTPGTISDVVAVGTSGTQIASGSGIFASAV
jgi:hypothetical protein